MTCAHTSTRSASRVAPPRRRDARAPVRRRPAAPHSFRCRAIRDACQQQQGRHDPGDPGEDQIRLAQVAALEAPRSQHVADEERGQHPTQDERCEDVDEQGVPALMTEPRQRGGGGRRTPIIAITIVGSSTQKPQKMNAWTSPGPSRASSLRWPSTIVASLRARRPMSPRRSSGAAARTRRPRNSARRAKSAPAPRTAAASATAAPTDAIEPPSRRGSRR